MYINASVLVFEIIFLLFFYKNMHSSKVRIVNEVFLVSLFSFSYTHFTFLHTITFTGIIYLLLTTLLLFSFSFVLTGLFEYQYGLLIFTLVNVLVYIGSEIKLSATGLPVAWTDFNSGLFIEVVWNMYLKQNYPYVILAIIILLGILYMELLSEYTEFNEGETLKDPGGLEFEVPTWATNKRTAKRYFKLEGWHYTKELVFCKDCFEQLEKGYVVIDQFHMFYNDEMICDIADPSFLMDLDQARQFSSTTYNNEVVYFKKAFPIICQSLREEWEVDVVGHYKAHSETRF